MELNLTLTGDNSNLFNKVKVKISEDGEIEMSKEEMYQII